MKKEIIKKNIGIIFNIDVEYPRKNTPIEALIEFLNDALQQGATHVEITGTCYDSTVSEVEIQPVKEELESDETLNKRIESYKNRQQKEKEIKERTQYAIYLELKKKYEK